MRPLGIGAAFAAANCASADPVSPVTGHRSGTSALKENLFSRAFGRRRLRGAPRSTNPAAVLGQVEPESPELVLACSSGLRPSRTWDSFSGCSCRPR